MICYWLVKDFSFGSYIYANDGKMDSGGDDGKVDRNSPIWGKNRSNGFKAWINGQVFSATCSRMEFTDELVLGTRIFT